MSINRKTKGYRKRVLRLANKIAFHAVTLMAGDVRRPIAEIVAEKEPDAPRYMVDDALALAIPKLQRNAADAEAQAKAFRQLMDEASSMRQSFKQRSKLRLVVNRGAA